MWSANPSSVVYRQDMGLSDERLELVTGALNLFAILGSLASGVVADRLGRCAAVESDRRSLSMRHCTVAVCVAVCLGVVQLEHSLAVMFVCDCGCIQDTKINQCNSKSKTKLSRSV